MEIAQAIGITERAVRKIMADLHAAGYIETEKIGRRNRYRVDTSRPLRRVGERDLTVGELLAIVPARGSMRTETRLANGDRPRSADLVLAREPARAGVGS